MSQLCQLREHPREICRIVLQIAIERRDDLAPAGLEAGPERRALAALPSGGARRECARPPGGP